MKHGFTRMGFMLLLAIACGARGASSCQPLMQRTNSDSQVQDHGLTRPGHYCLKEDIFVKGHRSLAEGGRVFNVSKVIVNIAANEVVLDLNGRAAWSDGRLEAGIETTLADKHVPIKNSPRDITVRNGSLRLERSGIGIRFSGLGGLDSDKWPRALASDYGEARASSTTTGDELKRWVEQAKEGDQRRVSRLWDLLPKIPGEYPVRNLRIENMRIRTQASAAVLQGARSVIRDSVIEVAAGTALWIYGPGAVIENNTIVVHGKAPGPDPLLEADAPIRLIHADGAVIRNNRIVAADAAHKRAISLFDTGSITVESNRFEGMSQTDEWAKAFRGRADVRAQGNTFGPVGPIHPPWWERLGR
jgi:hypothetical protein